MFTFRYVTDCGSSEAITWNHQCHLHWEDIWDCNRCCWPWTSAICEL